MSKTTSSDYLNNRALEELSEQIKAVVAALDIVRRHYNQQQNQTQLSPSQPRLLSDSTKKVAATANNSFIQLTGKQHPLVLGIWATCPSESDFRSTLGRTLIELIQEKRKHARELEIARETRRYLDAIARL